MVNASKAGHKHIARYIVFAVFAIAVAAAYMGCGKEKIIIQEPVLQPGPVTLVYPPADTFITVNTPTFQWRRMTGVTRYQFQVADASDFINKTTDIQTADTFYTYSTTLPNGTHFWRVRAQNTDGIWGDWSDATIRALFKSDYVNYFELQSETNTYGIPQDVFVRNDTAFVADGQAGLTMIDVSDPLDPVFHTNIESYDFAKGIYINPQDTFPYVMVADMDGRVYAFNLQEPARTNDIQLTSSQNLEEVTGFFKYDTLWIATVSSATQRNLQIIQIRYVPFIEEHAEFYSPFELPAPGMGVCIDSAANNVFVACGVAGLRIYDISDIYQATHISWLLLPSISLAVDTKDGYVYVAADRAGLHIVDARDPHNPVLVKTINTSGRTKDVQVLGNYAFIADADGGLKAIDISRPDSAAFVAAYATPYAYGVYATPENLYLCDRDLGLMIFENRTTQ